MRYNSFTYNPIINVEIPVLKSSYLGNVLTVISDRKLQLPGIGQDELYQNNFNDGNLSNITGLPNAAAISINSNQLRISPQAALSGVNISVPCTPNINNSIEFDLDKGTADASDGLTLAITSGGTTLYSSPLSASSGHYKFSYQATTAQVNIKLYFTNGFNTPATVGVYPHSNHAFSIDNILVSAENSAKSVVNNYMSQILETHDYYAFGMDMPGRTTPAPGSIGQYRFGFNGKEEELELGSGAYADFGARMYDERLGRFMSTDPLENKYPAYSPYNYAINSPIACKDNEGKNPIITTQMINGVLQITVHQRVYLVMDNMKNVKEAMSLVGNPIPYFTGNPSNSVGSQIIDENGTAVPVVFNFVYDVGVYEKEQEAKDDCSASGYGVIAYWKDGKDSPSWTKGSQDVITMYSQNTRPVNNYRGEFAHELTHDWAGLNDMYIIVIVDGRKLKGMVVADPSASYNNVQPFRDLMNDANSPLSPFNISRVAQAIYNMYGSNCSDNKQPLDPTLLTSLENGNPVSVTVESYGFWYNSSTDNYRLAGFPLHQISGNIIVIEGEKYLNSTNARYRLPAGGGNSRWKNFGGKNTKHKVTVPQAKL